ncbi:MAG: TIGR04211 family SH3 domain-containing protein [Gammaproteobacteria bacterium]|jgi:SH3 domain protein|nr:TIGR04211 family SH3 domain-containing protein [Gammaproteobacteria bacterium]MBT3722377.1 TIGR04211 family SH3 domain-containing protein [Gammaproteobacteria bacterium]MBT4075313.1 TIGR04211 family SH3 domain-containing protein [Gammaproteobacteria bacterium]MBT4193237.1 TIGR04211 family SH3 domain-containing protein [Gammaproteobacteria bacterium]MBT4450950.1 TIGR04211 family SH3 domain-containing protein [Gammaproteobacteria bacterium]
MKKIAIFIYLIIFTLSLPVWAQEADSEINNDEISQQNITEEVKEKKYVTDKLRLSLYKKPDSNSGTLKLLTSGDVLDVLERSGPYSKVITADGKRGWVKNGFLVNIPTASYLLIEEQKKNTDLSSQLDKFSNTQKIVDDYENTIIKMNADNESTVEELSRIQQEFNQISEKNNDLMEEIDTFSQDKNLLSIDDIINTLKLYWYVVLITILLLFLLGFMIGKNMVEAKVKKRFQGVKVL